MKPLPPLNFDTALDLWRAVQQVHTLRDMGIQPHQDTIRLWANCSRHGKFWLPAASVLDSDGFLTCQECRDEGITRRFPIYGFDQPA